LLIFIDTEFTDFIYPHLISLGMASEYGEDFYTEVPYPDHVCSAFACETAVPLLEKIPHSFFTRDNLRLEIIKWMELVRSDKEEVFICVDYQTDWDLFCEALDNRVPPWCQHKLVSSEIVELMLFDFFKNSGLPEHHALYDAQANRHAYRLRI
jgi:hypothetical protein